MSDASNLNAFFAQNSKKNKKAKKPAAKAKTAAAIETREEEVKEEATPAVQPETTQAATTTNQEPAQQDFADSSDDESNTIVLNEGRQKVIDRKDLEASKKTKEEESSDATAGWGLGSKLGGQQAEASAASQPSSASATGPQKGGAISFGKPTFSRKQKGIMDQQDFPDLADAANGSKATGNAGGASKANSAMMFSGGAAARGPRAAGDGAQGAEEVKTGATKPVFRGKAKFATGGATNEEMANSRMNYDFSKMRMSAATSKAQGAAGADGENPREGNSNGDRRFNGNQQSSSMNEDDDFEVVTEKKKVAPRREFEEPKFGGGMPMFTRGGDNRK